MGKRKAASKSTSKNPAKRPIEQYEHADKRRANNPHVGLVTPATDPPETARKTYAYDPHLDPQLVWAGKAERTSFEVPTVSLHVHERIDPRTIIEAVRSNGHGRLAQRSAPSPGSLRSPPSPGLRPPSPTGRGEEEGPARQMSLFDQPAENPPLREAIDFYKHPHGWSNRLIAGDSLLVMNSLLEKEGMAGKVQMVYIDPPYGIRYGSNFQPFVNRREVKDRKDDDLTQEPEMLKAFRDTWELGIHSYLSYLRDRLLLARDLLHESGSVFVQISDENIHHVQETMAEVFGADNFMSLIAFRKSGGTTSQFLASPVDFLIWYAKDRKHLKYRPLYQQKSGGAEGAGVYFRLMSADGKSTRLMTKDERRDPTQVSSEWKIYRWDVITSQGFRTNTTVPFEFEGQTFHPGPNSNWKATIEGMKRLVTAGRVAISGSSLAYVRYLEDFPVYPIDSVWDDTGTGSFTEDKTYVVQTGTKVIARCLLMSTDPGDLVFDPTCGSGTTAFVAEQWGRRWITCDTSRVAITLAKQRLMTASFDYYELAHPEPSPGLRPPSPTGRGEGEGDSTARGQGEGASSGRGEGEGTPGVHNGFRYKTVPHVTLKSIANNPEIKEGMTRVEIDAAIARYAEQETLYDQPYVDKSKVRVTGPFTVEAVPAPTVLPIDDIPLPPGEGGRRPGEGSEDRSESGEQDRRPSEQKPPLPEDLKQFARTLRAEQTDAEKLLWQALRNRRFVNMKFRRQHPIEPYILDFYCPEAKLAIELDGGQHNTAEAKAKDEARTAYLERQGIRVLRFWNYEVFEETEGVFEAIYLALTPTLSQREREKEGTTLSQGEGERVAVSQRAREWTADASVARSGVTLRQDEWRSEMAKTGVRAQGGKRVEFARLEPMAGARYLHAVGETKPSPLPSPLPSPRPSPGGRGGNGSKLVAVSFGPEHSPLEQRQVELAWEEARGLSPRPEMLIFAAFHFDPEAAKDIDELDPQKTGMTFLRSQMNTDLLTEDLKKKRSSNESFWLIGQPDVELRRVPHPGPLPAGEGGRRPGEGQLWQVEIRGFDYYNPTSGQIESGDSSKIAMWLLDTDYDGRSLLPRQVFFPMAGPKDGWARLAKSLKAEIDEDKIEAYRGTTSLPFEPGKHKRIAVKIVDDRGIESLKLMELG